MYGWDGVGCKRICNFEYVIIIKQKFSEFFMTLFSFTFLITLYKNQR